MAPWSIPTHRRSSKLLRAGCPRSADSFYLPPASSAFKLCAAELILALPEVKSKLHQNSGRIDAGRKKRLESLEFVLDQVLKAEGSEQAAFLLDNLMDRVRATGVKSPSPVST